MANLPKWTEERTEALVNYIGDESPVTQETVAKAAVEFETTNRSISSKLRKMDYDVELASSNAQKRFSDEQAAELENFVVGNSGSYTYAEIAEHFGQGFTAKQIQGKILSLELTEHVKPTPKPETVRSYSVEEEAVFIDMAKDGCFLEEIADALGKPLNSVRGKALSLMRAGDIDSIPKQNESKAKDKVDPLTALGDVQDYTVEKLAEILGKTPRGIRTMLTRRGITISDYDGAGKKAKAGAAE
jgi:hypothetical protein